MARPESPGPPDGDEDEDKDKLEAEGEKHWEQPVIDDEPAVPLEIPMEGDEQRALNDWTQAEEPLWNDPTIVPFPGVAGAPVKNEGRSNYDKYSDSIDGSNNPNVWWPFASKLEWEFAHWAKMRGPGSTAVTELLNIEGVSHFSIQDSPGSDFIAWPFLGAGKTRTFIHNIEATQSNN